MDFLISSTFIQLHHHHHDDKPALKVDVVPLSIIVIIIMISDNPPSPSPSPWWLTCTQSRRGHHHHHHHHYHHQHHGEPALKVDVVPLSNVVWIERLPKVDRWRRWVWSSSWSISYYHDHPSHCHIIMIIPVISLLSWPSQSLSYYHDCYGSWGSFQLGDGLSELPQRWILGSRLGWILILIF